MEEKDATVVTSRRTIWDGNLWGHAVVWEEDRAAIEHLLQDLTVPSETGPVPTDKPTTMHIEYGDGWCTACWWHTPAVEAPTSKVGDFLTTQHELF